MVASHQTLRGHPDLPRHRARLLVRPTDHLARHHSTTGHLADLGTADSDAATRAHRVGGPHPGTGLPSASGSTRPWHQKPPAGFWPSNPAAPPGWTYASQKHGTGNRAQSAIFELLTPCMPSAGSTSTDVYLRRSPSRSGHADPLSSAPVTVLSCCTNPDSPFPARAPRSDVEYDRCMAGPGPGHPLADRRSCHTIDSLFCPISVLDPSLHIIQPVTFLPDRPHPGLRDVETGPGPMPSNQCVFYTAATRRAESN